MIEGILFPNSLERFARQIFLRQIFYFWILETRRSDNDAAVSIVSNSFWVQSHCIPGGRPPAPGRSAAAGRPEGALHPAGGRALPDAALAGYIRPGRRAPWPDHLRPGGPSGRAEKFYPAGARGGPEPPPAGRSAPSARPAAALRPAARTGHARYFSSASATSVSSHARSFSFRFEPDQFLSAGRWVIYATPHEGRALPFESPGYARPPSCPRGPPPSWNPEAGNIYRPAPEGAETPGETKFRLPFASQVACELESSRYILKTQVRA